MYTCEVTNVFGSHRQDMSLVIHGEWQGSGCPQSALSGEWVPAALLKLQSTVLTLADVVPTTQAEVLPFLPSSSHY